MLGHPAKKCLAPGCPPTTSLSLLWKASAADHEPHSRVSTKVNFLPSSFFSSLPLFILLSCGLRFSSGKIYQVEQSMEGEGTAGKEKVADGGMSPLWSSPLLCLLPLSAPSLCSTSFSASNSGRAHSSHPARCSGCRRWSHLLCSQALVWGPWLPLAWAPCSVSSSICSSGGCTSESTSPQTGRPQPG